MYEKVIPSHYYIIFDLQCFSKNITRYHIPHSIQIDGTKGFLFDRKGGESI